MSIAKALKSELEKCNNSYTKKNLKETLKKIKSVIMTGSPSDRTITVRYSIARNMFKDKHGAGNDIIKDIRPDPKLTEKVIKENIEIRDDRKMFEVNEELFKKILSLKSSTNVYDKFLYALIVSGRRTSELLDADFSSGKGHLIKMDGLLKTRGDDKVCEFAALITKTKFLKLIKNIKKEIKQRRIRTFKKNLDNRINQLFNKVLNPHMLRAIYANYLFKFFNKENVEINPFIQKVLCHKTVNASLSYTGIKIAFENKIKI